MEAPEKLGKAGPYPEGASFGKLLDWHMKFGTRPTGGPDRAGVAWTLKGFTHAVHGGGISAEGSDGLVRAMRNWLKNTRPRDLPSILRELFGANPAHDEWRADLEAAYDRIGQKAATNSVDRPPTHFLGRDRDVAAIRDAIMAAPAAVAILVQGGPGIGKSSLTRAIAWHPEIVARYGEGNRWFVALDTAATALAMRDEVTRAVGGDPAASFDATLALLGRVPGLVVLDNLETPWDPADERCETEGVLAALAAVPGLALLASFRGRDRIGGPAWALVHPVEQLAPPFDAELFGRIANDSFDGDPHLADFLAALGGVPLAIELVAARAYGRGPLAKLWAEWLRIGVKLARIPDGDDGRLTSLEHSIELSLGSERMSPAAHRLFRLLGQLPAGLCAEDRDALIGEGGFDAEEALLRIGLAIERDGRLDLLPPIRAHADRAHRPDPPDAEAWPAHYLALTRERGETIGSRAGEGAVARLIPDFTNIVAAIQNAIATGRRLDAMAALHGFGRLTMIAALPAPVLAELAVACSLENDSLGEANCIMSSGDIAFARSDHRAARDAFERALTSYRQVGDLLGEANCIKNLGNVALARSDHNSAREAFHQALPLFSLVSDVLGEANCIVGLGTIALGRSDHDAARKTFERARNLYRNVGAVFGEANCIFHLGNISLMRCDHDVALEAFDEALLLYRQVGAVLDEANCIFSLGDIALRRSDHDAARKAYEQALLLYRQVGAVLGEANCIFRLGEFSLGCSNYNIAQEFFGGALLLYCEVGDIIGEANCIRSIGEIALKRLDYDAARKAFGQALTLYHQIGNVLGEANCIDGFGEIAFARLDYNTAREAYERAVTLYRQVGDILGEANSIFGLGEIALACSDHNAARKALELALPLYKQFGYFPGENACIENLKNLGKP